MIELPDFTPLAVTQTQRAPTPRALAALDHLIVALPKKAPGRALSTLVGSSHLARQYARAVAADASSVTMRLDAVRGAAVTASTFTRGTPFAALTWARNTLAEVARERGTRVGIVALGLDDGDAQLALESLVAAAWAAAFAMPSYKSAARTEARIAKLTVFAPRPLDLETARAAALGNNVARWFTVLPPNELNAASYRNAIETLARERSITARFLSEAALEKAGAGAFLAVSRGNADRDAGIVHLRYRPAGKTRASPDIALVGKGIIFDTGGNNLKPFKGMLDMHGDMQGSAVALGTLLALAELKAPYAVDAWLAITENRLSATAYKSQDVVRAANGTTIQVIHTDAEGRMVLADTLALASREKPALIVDYATLTGVCIWALTERYSGVFANRAAAHGLLVAAGAASGERVWPFPLDDDFDEMLKSEIADIKQCSAESQGDHILAARFLKRFVPDEIPWLHVDMSAAQHKGGLAHVPTEITGFGVRLTLELLNANGGPSGLVAKLGA
jgi:leucyl aminopeptidase